MPQYSAISSTFLTYKVTNKLTDSKHPHCPVGKSLHDVPFTDEETDIREESDLSQHMQPGSWRLGLMAELSGPKASALQE